MKGVPTASLSTEILERIGPYYVYVLVDPRTESIFYVGKGTGQRLLVHGDEALLKADPGPRSGKVSRIHDIRAAGLEPRIDVIRHGLDEDDAFQVEGALIDSLDGLTNAVRGHGAERGRASLDELKRRYGAVPLDDDAPPVLLIRLGAWKEQVEEIEPGTFREGHGFREGMTPDELVQSARAWWANISSTGAQRRGIRHAVAVHRGITRAVMEIGDWIQRGNRWAFAATSLTNGPVHDAWVGPLGRRVEFKPGSQSPAIYWTPASSASACSMTTGDSRSQVAASSRSRRSRESGTARPVGEGAPPAVLIRLGSWRDNVLEIEPGVHRKGAGYREDMSLTELVDAARAWWRISPERVAREGIRHAVAVHQGITRGVMVIGDWLQRADGRWAFAATPLTAGPVYDEWVGRSGRIVDFTKGSQNPIAYWPPK